MLGVQTFLLLDEDECRTGAESNHENDQSYKESYETVAQDETDDGWTCCGCCPVDVSSLNTHEFQWSLKTTEYGVLSIVAICHRHSGLESEEHRQSLCSCDEEDTSANDHHDLLLENLPWDYKTLIINTSEKQKQPKETNWKQKFRKPQNENICLTYLNMEMNGNFHFLSFYDVVQMGKNSTGMNLFVESTIGFIRCVSWRKFFEKCVFGVEFHSIFAENTVGLISFWCKESFMSQNFHNFASNYNQL